MTRNNAIRTTTFKTGDRVRVAPDAKWVDGTLTDSLQELRGTVTTVSADRLDGDGDLAIDDWNTSVDPKYLTLVEEPIPEPAPAVTDEQRAAWQRLYGDTTPSYPEKANDLELLRCSLPSELTNPQPALPTELGAAITGQFEGCQVIAVRGVQAWSVLFVDHGNHEWHSPENMALQISDAVPLVPERPQITREQIEDILRDYHAEQEAGLVQRLLALVNGAGQ